MCRKKMFKFFFLQKKKKKKKKKKSSAIPYKRTGSFHINDNFVPHSIYLPKRYLIQDMRTIALLLELLTVVRNHNDSNEVPE